MSGWLNSYPMLTSLREDPQLQELGIQWLENREKAENLRENLIRKYQSDTLEMGVLWIDGLWEASGEDAQNRLRVADGPNTKSYRIPGGSEFQGGLYIDVRFPERLFYTPNNDIPPPLWIEVEPDVARITTLLKEYHPVPSPTRLQFSGLRRAFAGRLNYLYVPSPYSGDLEYAGPHELERHLNFSPFVEPVFWGTAYEEDPWLQTLEGNSMLEVVALGRKFQTQAEGAVCTRSRRTLFSRAIVSLEFHGEGRYVWQIQYSPSAFPKTIQRFNDCFQTLFDEDLPIDVVGVLIGMGYISRTQIIEEVERCDRDGEPSMVAHWLSNLAALEHNNIEIIPLLRRYASSTEEIIKGTIINLGIDYNWRSLIEDIAFNETDPRFIDFFKRCLQYDFVPPPVNEFGEPENLWTGIDDEAENEDDVENEK